MDPHPIQFFFRHAGHLLRPLMETATFDASARCSDCDVEASNWPEPGVGVSFHQYGRRHTHCTACHSLYQGSFDMLGVERYAKGTPVAMKLGMLTGCGALITPEKTTLFLNAFYDKIAAAPKPPPFELKRVFGKPAHQHVMANPPSQPFLYIGDFGRKKDELIASMAMSDSTTLAICTADGATHLPIEATRGLIETTQDLDQSVLNKLKRHLSLQLRGLESPTDQTALKDFEKAAEQSPGLFPALRRLPADPHLTLDILTYI